MTIGLWEIAQHAARQRVKLFSEKSHVVTSREQALKEPASFGAAVLQDVVLDEPEAARQKGTLTRRKSIAGIFSFITPDEFATDHEFLFDCLHGSPHTRIGCRKKADQRDQQQACVESPRPVGLYEAVQVMVEAVFTDLRMNLIGDRFPAQPRVIERSTSRARPLRDRMQPKP